MSQIYTMDFSRHLPPYRSLLSPEASYDYEVHKLVPFDKRNGYDDDRINTRTREKASQNNKINGEIHFQKQEKLNTQFHQLTSAELDASKNKIRMKYQSLLSDGVHYPLISVRLNGNNFSKPIHPKSIKLTNLPMEILERVFDFISSKKAHYNCMFVCRKFYILSRTRLYQNISFTSTYRFAQFITYLRLDKEVGKHVLSVDLSNIESGSKEKDFDGEDYINLIAREIEDTYRQKKNVKILAGWRDWKFKNNPVFYTAFVTQPSSNHCHVKKLSKTNSKQKLKQDSNYRSGHHYVKDPKKYVVPKDINLDNEKSHPIANRFLEDYATAKDIPIGYILHLLALCPNIISLNLGNLQVSTDYELSASVINEFKSFDVLNNYPASMIEVVHRLLGFNSTSGRSSTLQMDPGNQFGITSDNDPRLGFKRTNFSYTDQENTQGNRPFSSKLKYNSLLSPTQNAISDSVYSLLGEGKVYLSDLRLKSVNRNYLRRLKEDEILQQIVDFHNSLESQIKPKSARLQYVNLSRMIWLNRSIVSWFLEKMLLIQSTESNYSYSIPSSASSIMDSDENDDDTDIESLLSSRLEIRSQNITIDLTDSGMHKDLPWATKLDFTTVNSRLLALKLIRNYSIDPVEESRLRERERRGRMGENYFS